ncbi:unnamed protein product [Penicillium nalgiovense]|uniref:RNA polymerase II-associated protein 1 N-terminal domain-containing protein n=1 Tax=Penicillium nalgiovense TaxID=60175 RepID=A0A1V6XU90_PENNA|nr:hypothetical protein PENNAL_c0054G07268 [Penicillium nalgiovense]CAG7949496.1 unnamed protein product [Penicillium nalgiovense]CAG7972782.1 unnamed protein product [Penicillium nalgiovense]CAG8030995.1 unnamed protein product [Penicillium nalgiovense]CAG8035571.1 unnamed protein product [Penicillium nalgiovense]
MAFRGERFVLDLDEESGAPEIPSPFSLIGEIQERAPSTAIPPAPKLPTSSTGFPAPRQRKPSSFKQRRANQSTPPAPAPTEPTVQDEKISIDEENRRQLAAMSDAQIQQEREELMEQMDPGLLERFLRRANIEEDQRSKFEPASVADETSKPKKSVSFDIPPSAPVPAPSAESHSIPKPPSKPHPRNEDLAPPTLPEDLHPASERPSLDPATIETFHFPQPTAPMPVLDPSSPSFLSDLQSHYFPEIAQDPSTLSWLQPLSADEEDPDSTSAYHPASNAISMAPSAIRFSLTGTILAPETSLSLPTTMGLHHHGEDPHAAGYTIPELAILSRSTFPAQRCIAWQVIGRILFRLGRAEFGERGGQLSDGLWFVIEKEGIVAGMLAEADGAAGQTQGRDKSKNTKDAEEGGNLPLASGVGRHASAAAWAVEGIWLWQKGGGGDRGLLKEGQHRSL